jgi:hypothetical protein
MKTNKQQQQKAKQKTNKFEKQLTEKRKQNTKIYQT